MKLKPLAMMVGIGVACGVMLWIALWAASGIYDTESIVGAVMGGAVTGLIMHVLG